MTHPSRHHVTATCHQALEYLAEIERVAANEAGGDGTHYAPLPPLLKDALLGAVHKVSADLRVLVRRIAPDAAVRSSEPKSLGATIMWLSTMLYMAQEQVEELDAGRLARRYGALDAADAEALAGLVERSLMEIKAAMAELP